MSSTKTSSPVTIIIGIIAVGVIVLAAFNLPSRMPPDPFEQDELREVIMEVEWDEDPRGQLVAWDIGDDEGELHTEGIANANPPGGWRWNHITTARQGTTARVSSIQDSPGPVLCAIYVDNRQIAADGTTDPHGCFAEATIP